MNIALLSLPRSGTRYISHLISQSPSIVKFIDEPFKTDETNVVISNYIAYCESQLNNIEKHSDGLLIKDNITFELATLINENNSSAINFFNRYKTILKNNLL